MLAGLERRLSWKKKKTPKGSVEAEPPAAPLRASQSDKGLVGVNQSNEGSAGRRVSRGDRVNEAPNVTLNDFLLLTKLGEGGFGKVVLARKKLTGTMHAIKVLDKSELLKQGNTTIRHVLEENRILKSLHHPFVLTLHYTFQDADRLYLVTQWVGGGDLFEHLQAQGHFPGPWCTFYAAQLTCAIAHIHDRGIVYRDLKPENVLLGLDGYIVLCDFGLAKKILRDRVDQLDRLDDGDDVREFAQSSSSSSSSVWANVADGGGTKDAALSDLPATVPEEDDDDTGLDPLPASSSSNNNSNNNNNSNSNNSNNTNNTTKMKKKRGRPARLERCNTFCGTALYLAPEVISKEPYGPSVDMWTLGCLLVEMLTGSPPFVAYNFPSLMKLIQSGEPVLSPEVALSPEAVDLIRGLLDRNPATRIGCRSERGGESEVKAHAFFSAVAWDDLLKKKLEAPFLPKTSNALLNEVLGLHPRPHPPPSDDAAAKETRTSSSEEKEKEMASDALNKGFEYFAAEEALEREDLETTHHLLELAREGDVAGLRTAVDAGVDLSRADSDAHTALTVAASEGHLDFVQELIKLAVDLNACDRFGHTALDHAQREGFDDVVQELKAHGARHGAFLAQPQNININNNNHNNHNHHHCATELNVLFDAVLAGDVEASKVALAQGATINGTNHDKRTALHLAAGEGRIDMIEFLINEGAHVNAIDRWECTPLQEALFSQEDDVIQYLKRYGARLGPSTRHRAPSWRRRKFSSSSSTFLHHAESAACAVS